MSFDPYGQPPAQPQPPATQPSPPTGPPDKPAREKVLIPAIMLIIFAVLNLLAAFYPIINLVLVLSTTAEKMHEQQVAMYESLAKSDNKAIAELVKPMAEQMRKQDPDAFRNQAILLHSASAVIGLVIGLLGLLGGVRMIQLRSFGLAITGAVATAIPCLSLSGCCCGLGQVVAIWCIVVLLNPEVRAAFGGISTPRG